MNSEGWIHRDVKPDNFLVSNEGVVKLIDFAISVKQRAACRPYFRSARRRYKARAAICRRADPQPEPRSASRHLQLRVRVV
jgi:serine/threonine protein kinase